MSVDHEMRFRIYHPDCGEYVEVAEDGDGLGLLELRARDENDKIMARITLTDEQVTALIRSLQILREFVAARNEDALPGDGADG